MAKTETNVSTLKINRGTYAKVQENLSSITENELIITSDKNVPVPTTNDNGKAVVVNASGEYELGNAGMSQSDADARYLQLSGGTMTGDIVLPAGRAIKDDSNKNLLFSGNGQGGNQIGNQQVGLTLYSNNSDIIHYRSSTQSTLLDSVNTSANPTLSGGEATLSSLKLNGTNYAVGGGSSTHLYQHDIAIRVNSATAANVFCSIINDSATVYTQQTFAAFLYNNGYVHGGEKCIVANGTFSLSGESVKQIVCGITANSDPDIRFKVINMQIQNNYINPSVENTFATSIDAFTDNVRQIV